MNNHFFFLCGCVCARNFFFFNYLPEIWMFFAWLCCIDAQYILNVIGNTRRKHWRKSNGNVILINNKRWNIEQILTKKKNEIIIKRMFIIHNKRLISSSMSVLIVHCNSIQYAIFPFSPSYIAFVRNSWFVSFFYLSIFISVDVCITNN